MSLLRQYVIEIATGLRDHERAYRLCPSCNGGTSGERSFSVVRQGYDALFMCHRASCGFKGSGSLAAGLLGHPEVPDVKPQIPEPYSGPLVPLPASWLARLQTQYGIPFQYCDRYIKSAGQGWFALPIFSPGGLVRGYTIRWPWGQPGLPASLPKSKVFMENEGLPLAWYGLEHKSQTVWLVEDQLSALRLYARYAQRTAALIGTDLSARKVSEIQAAGQEVLLALDNDATAKAFDLARQWQAAFKSLRVVVLDKDIKDMAIDALSALVRSQVGTT